MADPSGAARREWLCPECDWIGSPDEAPAACPNCGWDELMESEEDCRG